MSCMSRMAQLKIQKLKTILIRMKNELAYYAVVDLLTYRDAERIAFSFFNHYIRFFRQRGR